METVIEARNISKVYEGNGEDLNALKQVNLLVKKGESLAIIGKSGSGKSTLMHVLATLDRPSQGELLVDGKPTSKLSTKEIDDLRNQKFGFVFQQFFVNGRNTVLENVLMPLVISGVPKQDRLKRGHAVLASVGLSEKANVRASDLSGGQKQRLCIARAIIMNPEVIFADEPTGNLDSENGENIIKLLFSLQREHGITLVFVTHDQDLAALCGRTVILRDGEIIS